MEDLGRVREGDFVRERRRGVLLRVSTIVGGAFKRRQEGVKSTDAILSGRKECGWEGVWEVG